MFDFLHRMRLVDNIIRMLSEQNGMNKYPNLAFKYTLHDGIFTMVFPSNEQYMFSFLDEELTVVYHKNTDHIQVTPDHYNLMSHLSGKKLARYLKKSIIKYEEREAFIHMIVKERKRMSVYIDPQHRSSSKQQKSKRDKDGSVYRDFIYSSADDSSGHSDGSSSHDHHSSSHHNDN